MSSFHVNGRKTWIHAIAQWNTWIISINWHQYFNMYLVRIIIIWCYKFCFDLTEKCYAHKKYDKDKSTSRVVARLHFLKSRVFFQVWLLNNEELQRDGYTKGKMILIYIHLVLQIIFHAFCIFVNTLVIFYSVVMVVRFITVLFNNNYTVNN